MTIKILDMWLRYTPLLAALIVLSLSVYIGYLVKRDIDDASYHRYEEHIDNARKELEKRFLLYTETLHAAAGFLNSSQEVEAEEWQSYARSNAIMEKLKGISGLGVVSYVQERNLGSFLERLRGYGYQDFVNYPQTESEYKYIVTFISPDYMNDKVLGLDLAFDKSRRQAADIARDTNDFALSSRVHLIQRAEQEPGFLLLYPIYERNKPHETIEERRENIKGWVYAPFYGMAFLESLSVLDGEHIAYQVYEGEEMSEEALIYSSNLDHMNDGFSKHPIYEDVDLKNFAGQVWTIHWMTTPDFAASRDYSVAVFVLIGGAIVSFGFFFVLTELFRGQLNAKRLADERAERMRQQLALQGGDLGIWDIDFVGNETYFSDQWFAMLGYETNDFPSGFKAWVNLIHPEDHERCLKLFEDHVAYKTDVFYAEHRLKCKDDSWKWVLAKGRLIERDSKGQPVRALGMNVDITEQKESELAAKRRAQMLELAEDTAQLGHWRYDVINEDIFWSDQIYHIHGVSKESFQPDLENAIGFYHPDDQDFVREMLEQAIEARESFEATLRLIRKNGMRRYVEARGCPEVDEEGKVIAIFGVFQDVTDRYADRKAIEESEKILDAILGNAADGIISIMPTGEILNFNKSCERIFGYEEKEVIGKNVSMLVPIENRPYHDGYIQNYFVSGKSEIIGKGRDVRAVRKDGEIIDIYLAVSDINVDGKRIFTGVIRDVTEQLERERQLKEAKTFAEDANRLKTEFLANMSHEIRTPMNGVIGTTNLLQKTKLDKTQQKYTQIIVDSGNALLELINDVLDLSKIEAGKLDIVTESFNLRDFIQGVLSIHELQFNIKDVSLICECDEILPDFIISDPRRLRQILNNLLSNALKFTEEGSVTLKILQTGSKIRFQVMDTGIGIADDRVKYLFQSFSQAHAVSKNVLYGGTGLGLSIVQALAHLLGGDVGYEHNEPQGSVFWFFIPLQEGREEDVALKVDFSEMAQSYKAHVLLAEDVETNRLIMTSMLESFGVTYDVAENGQEALEKGLAGTYDMMFMDVRMPIMEGTQVTQEIRKQEKSGYRVPIVALTAFAMNDDKQVCLDSGMDDFMTKPLKSEDLHRMLDRWVGNLGVGGFEVNADRTESKVEEFTSGKNISEEDKILEGLQELREQNPDLYPRLVQACLKDIESRYVDINRCYEDQDYVGLADVAHAIKSVMAKIGAAGAAEALQSMEILCWEWREENVEELEVLMQGIPQAIENVVQILKQHAE